MTLIKASCTITGGKIIYCQPTTTERESLKRKGTEDFRPSDSEKKARATTPLDIWAEGLQGNKKRFFWPMASQFNFSGEEWLDVPGLREYNSTTGKCIRATLSTFKEQIQGLKHVQSSEFFSEVVGTLSDKCAALDTKYTDRFEKLQRAYKNVISRYEKWRRSSDAQTLESLNKSVNIASEHIIKVYKCMMEDMQQVALLSPGTWDKHKKQLALQAELNEKQTGEFVLVDLLGGRTVTFPVTGPEVAEVQAVADAYRTCVLDVLSDLKHYLQKALGTTPQIRAIYAEFPKVYSLEMGKLKADNADDDQEDRDQSHDVV